MKPNNPNYTMAAVDQPHVNRPVKPLRQRGIVLAMILGAVLAGGVRAGVNVSTASNADSVFYGSEVSATDLINSGQASFGSASNTVGPTSSSLDGTHDGIHGAAGSLTGKSWYLFSDLETTLTFNLNTNPLTGGSATGYSLNDVRMFAGWDSYAPFANQKWTLRVATVAAPTTFVDVQAVDYTPFGEGGGGSSKVSLTNFTGTAAEAGVAVVQFRIQRAGPAGRSTQGIVIGEIDVLGTPSAANGEPPPAPTGLAATVSSGQVILNWSAATGAASYTVKRALNNGGPYTELASNISATTYTNGGLTNGTTYYYVVAASNSNGTSPDSAQVSATPQAPPAGLVVATQSSATETTFDSQISATDLINSGQPSYLSAANTVAPDTTFRPFSIGGTHDGLTASWDADQTAAVARNTWYSAATTITYTLNTNPLTGGSETGYDLTAVNVFAGWINANMFQAQKWTMRVATVANPSVFTEVKAVDYNPPDDAKASLVSMAVTGGGPFATGVAAIQFVVGKVDVNGIVIREIDVTGVASGPVTEVPSAPGGLTAAAADKQVTLSWTAAARAASYTVKRSLVNGGPYTEVASNIAATTYTNTGLTNGTTYYYVVSARNSIGDSPDSNQAGATPQVPPAAPIRIMCVGDSITAGYTDNPSWNVPFQFGYRSGLYTRLSAAAYSFRFVGASPEPWNGAFGTPTNTPSPDLRTVDQDHHRGYGGWGTSGILSNIAGWLSTDNPDVVLLMIGINDGGSQAARDNLNNIVQTIVTNQPNARVIVAQITPTATFSQTLVDYNTYIRDTLVPAYQAQGKHVTTVNQYANLLTNGSIDPALFSNGINHPNAVAYDRMAQTWFDGIRAVEYVRWSEGFPGSVLTNPAADADGDGLTNQQEFAFGLDPTKASSVNPITNISTQQGVQFSYTRWATSGLTYSVWTSADLRNWVKDAGATQTPGTAVDGVQTVAVTLASPPAGDTFFVRVRAD